MKKLVLALVLSLVAFVATAVLVVILLSTVPAMYLVCAGLGIALLVSFAMVWLVIYEALDIS